MEVVALDSLDAVDSPEPFGLDREGSILLLQYPLHDEDGEGKDNRTVFLEEIGADDRRAIPLSSSSVRKTNPLAV